MHQTNVKDMSRSLASLNVDVMPFGIFLIGLKYKNQVIMVIYACPI